MRLLSRFFDSNDRELSRIQPLIDATNELEPEYERWAAEFSFMGKAQGGGSGWVLLTYSHRDRKLVNQWAADHTCSLAGATPILALDMYEHSYHVDYGAKAAAYVDASMNNINWANVARLYEDCAK